jgi:hypothetical protein
MFDELRAIADRRPGRLQADVARLTTELDQARRPWWRRCNVGEPEPIPELRRWRQPRPWRGHGEKAARACSGCPGRFGTPDNGATETTARPTRMVSNDPIKDYMRRHACSFPEAPEALEALAAQLGPPTAHDIRRALQTLGRVGAPVDILESLEAWSADQMQQAA